MALLELARRSAEEGRSLPVELRDEERRPGTEARQSGGNREGIVRR